MSVRRHTTLLCCATAVGAAVLSGCGAQNPRPSLHGANPGAAPRLIVAYGCGACHTIPGVGNADGRIAPSLAGIADRTYIAGKLPNNPQNLVRWIMHPQAVEPGTIMPDLGVGGPQARDIAAYLYRH